MVAAVVAGLGEVDEHCLGERELRAVLLDAAGHALCHEGEDFVIGHMFFSFSFASMASITANRPPRFKASFSQASSSCVNPTH